MTDIHKNDTKQDIITVTKFLFDIVIITNIAETTFISMQ